MSGLDAVRQQLMQQQLSAEQLIQEYNALWQTLGWQSSQVALWREVVLSTAVSKGPAETEHDLTQHLTHVLEKAGKPMPIGLLLKKLPAGVKATEQQLRKQIQQDSRLELKGPLVRLV